MFYVYRCITWNQRDNENVLLYIVVSEEVLACTFCTRHVVFTASTHAFVCLSIGQNMDIAIDVGVPAVRLVIHIVLQSSIVLAAYDQ